MVRFSNAQVAEAIQPFWAALQRGEFITDAAVQAGTYRKQGTRWVAACGGVRPRRGRSLKGRCLTFAEREEIALARARGETIRVIARRLSRAPSTVSRELRRNADRGGGYRATTAHALAYERASRPKPAKLAANLALRELVQDDLLRRYSPEQIAGRLRRQLPDNPEMWVSAETIYQSLNVQSRGALRRELTKCLRTGRSLRQPGRHAGQRKSRIVRDMVNISQRPAEAADRAVPGHWEGDLLIGKRNATAIATLVERTTGYAMLVALPDGYRPEHVAPALATKLQTLPQALRLSLTWDQGPEMRNWKQIRLDADIDIFFCDPHAPWQRGSNENTNGLLRQYFPKGTDFSAVTGPSSTPSPTSSTTDPASAWPSRSRSKRSPTSCCNNRQHPPIPRRHTLPPAAPGPRGALSAGQAATGDRCLRRRPAVLSEMPAHRPVRAPR